MPAAPTNSDRTDRTATWALILGAVGVVFGDIGTSPLYAVHAVFAGGRVLPTGANVYGVFSLVVWTLIVVVSVKYVTLVMRADSEGEGGIMALIARVESLGRAGARTRAALVAAGIFGAALFLGDGMITPAISVLSAVEGLELAAPQVKSLVVPITLVILTALFVSQRLGTTAVARFFGPVMVVWFLAIATAGSAELARDPGILRALSPTYGALFILDHPGVSFLALGAIVLTVTGAEALYADMGHFGRPAIRRAWFALVFPALALNYLGQGALLLRSPQSSREPFYLLIPSWGRLPMVILATAATVIASQAVISGAFSLARQAVRLGFLPRLTIKHTSDREIGQVYVPAINMTLFAGVVAIVLGFGSSARLASAYGIAVTGTFAITTVLFVVVARRAMGWSRERTLALAIPLLIVDVTFFAANLTKVADGGWLPLLIAVGAFVVLMTWRRGRELVTANRTRQEGALQSYIDQLNMAEPPLQRLAGTAVYLGADKATTPLALRAHVEHSHALHEEVVIVSVVTDQRAHVPETERVDIDGLGWSEDRIVHVTARFGFKDRHDVPAALDRAVAEGLALDVSNPSYFVSRISLKRTDAPGMARWRKRLFLSFAKLAANPVEYFGLPDDRVVILGSRVTL